MGKRRIHLIVNMQSSGVHPAAWRAADGQPTGFIDPAFHEELARLAERGLFDSLFLADHSALWANPAAGPGWAFDPIVTIASLARSTSHIGLVASVSTTFSSPYQLARTFASLDHISGGRIGWNVVTSWDERAARNFDIQVLPSRDERYQRAEEFVDVVHRLWNSWDNGAIVADKQSGVFADTTRIHPIDHKGRFYQVKGPLQVPRSPQGRPVLFQAGGSEAGRELAAKYADAVFTTQPTLESAQAYYADLRQRARRQQRPEGYPRVLPGVVVVVAETAEAARHKHATLDALLGSEEDLLKRFARSFCIPADRLELDKPFPTELIAQAVAANPRQGFVDALIAKLGNRSTKVRQHIIDGTTGLRYLVGNPDDVANSLQAWFEDYGADGFVLMFDTLPSGLRDFVDLVVPILQRRGLYPTEYVAETLHSRLQPP